jgi:leader peptidase (prepilin peptidase)/N-methyltransferase
MHPQFTAPIPRAIHNKATARDTRAGCPVLASLGRDTTTTFNIPQFVSTTSAPTVYSTQPMIRILGTIFAGLLGLAFGSFLNVCLTRWPEDESIVHPRSHCRNCDHALSWWENIPLFSWLFLRGRCRNCHTWIGVRYPLVELSIGILWATAVWGSFDRIFAPAVAAAAMYREIARMLGQMVFYWLMVALAVLDAENLWLPNLLTLPGTALGFVVFLLQESIQKFSGDFYPQHSGFAKNVIERVIAILIAAGIILLTRWLYWLVRHREGVGLGDAKLMALLAAWLGLPLTLLTFVISTFLGAVASLILLAVPSARTDDESWASSKLPLGTFLCIGGIISSLWGQPIVAAYLRLAGF